MKSNNYRRRDERDISIFQLSTKKSCEIICFVGKLVLNCDPTSKMKGHFPTALVTVLSSIITGFLAETPLTIENIQCQPEALKVSWLLDLSTILEIPLQF